MNVGTMKTPLPLLAALALAASPLWAADPAPSAPPAIPPAPPAVNATVVKNVTLDEAEKLLKEQKGIVVLDVRTAEEFKAGHLAGARNIDIMADDFAQQIAALEKGKTYLIHCAAGGRSGRACKVPEVLQLGTVYHMNEGFKAWEKAGKPVERPTPAPPAK